MATERLRLDFRHTTVYYETELNAVGATDSITLRPAPAAPAANDAYVRRWGTPYNILDVVAGTTIAAGAGAAGTVARFRIYSRTTGTLLGTITDTIGVGVVFADGAALAAAEPVYIVLDVTAGGPYTVAAAATITLCTNADPAGLATIIPREVVTIGAANAVTLYVANGGSTYYESTLKWGGARHTPVIGSARYSYFLVGLAIAASNACTEIVDSEIHDVSANPGIGIGANFRLQSSLGQTPTLQCGIGPRNTRFASVEYNNTTAIYVNKAGSDANAGTWQLPKLTVAAALVAAVAAAKQVVYGGLGATESAVFLESLSFGATRTLEADHLLTPTISYAAGNAIAVTGGTVYARGWYLTAWLTCLYQDGGGIEAYDCELSASYNGLWARTAQACVLSRCKLSAGRGVRHSAAAIAFSASYCEFVRCSIGVDAQIAFGNSIIQNCLFYRCMFGVWAWSTWAVGGTFQYCTLWGCTRGFQLDVAALIGIVPRDIIYAASNSAGIWINAAAGGLADNFCSVQGNTLPVGGLGAGGYAPANAIAGDPLLVDPANGWCGIRAGDGVNSPCYHADAGFDVGMNRYVFYFSGNSGVLDGFIVDGREHQWFRGITTFATRTGCTIKWCTIQGCAGTALDCYATAAQTWTINNVRIEDCGDGIMCANDTISIAECLVANCRYSAIFIGCAGVAIRHTTIAGVAVGLRYDALVGTDQAAILDSIFSRCGSYCVMSDAGGPVTLLVSCDADGTVSTGISLDGDSLQADPLFVDGYTNRHLRAIAGGYPFDSPCLEGASDGADMGCYLVARGVTDESIESYSLPFIGVELSASIVPKSEVGFETASGAAARAAKTHKRRFEISWPTDAAMTEEARRWIEYITTLIEDDAIGVTDEQGIIRLHPRPIDNVWAVTGPVDPAARTLWVPAGGMVRNAFRGYDATIEWWAQVNGVLDATAKTLTSAAAGWTINEWVGYWFRQTVAETCGNIGYNYFRILSNTAAVLTFSDPYDRSVAVGAGMAFGILSWHKILANDDLYFYFAEEGADLLRDEAAELRVEQISCRLLSSGLGLTSAVPYDSEHPEYMIPDKLTLEEC